MTMAENQDGLSTAPWYIAFFVRVGLPTAFAAVLLWFLMTNVTRTLADLHLETTHLSSNDTLIIQNQKEVTELLIQYAREMNANHHVLLAMCVNVARDEAARARCVEASK